MSSVNRRFALMASAAGALMLYAQTHTAEQLGAAKPVEKLPELDIYAGMTRQQKRAAQRAAEKNAKRRMK